MSTLLFSNETRDVFIINDPIEVSYMGLERHEHE